MIDRIYIVKCSIKLINKKYHLKSLFLQKMTVSNMHITSGKFVTTGAIVSMLHYDLYLRDW